MYNVMYRYGCGCDYYSEAIKLRISNIMSRASTVMIFPNNIMLEFPFLADLCPSCILTPNASVLSLFSTLGVSLPTQFGKGCWLAIMHSSVWLIETIYIDITPFITTCIRIAAVRTPSFPSWTTKLIQTCRSICSDCSCISTY